MGLEVVWVAQLTESHHQCQNQLKLLVGALVQWFLL